LGESSDVLIRMEILYRNIKKRNGKNERSHKGGTLIKMGQLI